MKIALGADHAGYELKEQAKKILLKLGHEVIDFGTTGKESVDYPDFGLKVGKAVAEGSVQRGMAVCWTGAGMTIAANKIKGVRAVLCLNSDMAQLARSHNDSNVLTLSQKYINPGDLENIIKTWLDTPFEGGRHERRINKISQAERE